jgi:TonB family protein
MRLTFVALLLSSLCFAQDPAGSSESKSLLNQGIAAYKNARYAEAIAAFHRASELDPSNLEAGLYLGTAYFSQYIPGAGAPENVEMAAKAKAAFEDVLAKDTNNVIALSSLASLAYQQSTAATAEEKDRKLNDAADWYSRLVAVEPDNREAFYSLGVIAWARVYPHLQAARQQLGMHAEDPGPLPSAALRTELRGSYEAGIEEGMSNLRKALELDPKYDDAMAYLNLLFRRRADLEDTPQAAQQDIAQANELVQRTLEVKQSKASPQPAPEAVGAASEAPQRICVGGKVEAENLITRVDPEYPALATEARIQGTVRFTVTIDKQGHVADAKLVSGHPLLVQSATDAVKQWVYKPMLLNGNPVEVVTQVDVNFTLP